MVLTPMNALAVSTDKDRRGGQRCDVCMPAAAVWGETLDSGVRKLAAGNAHQSTDLNDAWGNAHRFRRCGSRRASSSSSPMTQSLGSVLTLLRNGSRLRSRAFHSWVVITCSLMLRRSSRSAPASAERTRRAESSPRTMRSTSLDAVAEPAANDPKTNASLTPRRRATADRSAATGPLSLRTIDAISSYTADRVSAE